MKALKEGMVLRLSRHAAFGIPLSESAWEATIESIDEENDTLHMYVQGPSEHSGWHEEWILSHTQYGLNRGVYEDITPR